MAEANRQRIPDAVTVERFESKVQKLIARPQAKPDGFPSREPVRTSS
jgi:hypothetical protein